MNYKCEFCKEIFSNVKIKANHIRWKHKRKELSQESLKHILEAAAPGIKKRKDELEKNVRKELKTAKYDILKNLKIKSLKEIRNDLKINYGINNTNIALRILLENIDEKKIYKLGLDKKNRKLRLKSKKQYSCACKFCGKKIPTNGWNSARKKYCAKKCLDSARKKRINELRLNLPKTLKRMKIDNFYDYRLKSKFKFNVFHYPKYFNIDLIKKHGVYKAKNRGNNINGIQRDHIVSVKYGYIHGINPNIIRHPANCRLLLANENIKKHSRSDMTLKQLLKEIKVFEKIYGKQ